jgi:hypothetical protein
VRRRGRERGKEGRTAGGRNKRVMLTSHKMNHQEQVEQLLK